MFKGGTEGRTDGRKDGHLKIHHVFYRTLAGLILGIFLTEPVGLAPHHLTEPERKTMCPVKMLCQILQSYQPRFVKVANDYVI